MFWLCRERLRTEGDDPNLDWICVCNKLTVLTGWLPQIYQEAQSWMSAGQNNGWDISYFKSGMQVACFEHDCYGSVYTTLLVCTCTLVGCLWENAWFLYIVVRTLRQTSHFHENIVQKTNHTEKKHKLQSKKECLLFSKQCFAHTAITVFNLKQYNTWQEKHK